MYMAYPIDHDHIQTYFSDRTKGVLNRTVILVEHNDDGFVFITERNTQKYKDFVSEIIIWGLPMELNKFPDLNVDGESGGGSYFGLDFAKQWWRHFSTG